MPSADATIRHTDMQDLAVRWTRAQPAVAGFIASLVPNHHDAEDLLQRTAASLVTKYASYDRSSPFLPWAVGVARIEVLRYRQERGRDRLTLDPEAIERVARVYQTADVEWAEVKTALDDCISKLSGKVRAAMNSFYATGRSPKQIAGELGSSVNSVLVSLSRGRSVVRDCMKKRLGSDVFVAPKGGAM